MDAGVAGLLGVAFGALAGLTGTWITLRHDAKQRKLDREIALRREVYLEAAEGLAEVQLLLTRLAQPDFKPDQIGGSAGSRIGWYNKVQVVSSFETFEAFAKGEALFQSALVGLLPKRYEFDQVQLRLDSVQARKSQLAEYQQALHSGLKVLLAQGAPADVDTRGFSQGILAAQAQIDNLGTEEAELLAQKADRQRELLLEVNKRAAELRRLYARAMVTLRLELDLPMETDRYHAAIEEVLDKSDAAWRQLLREEPDDTSRS